MPNIKSAKKRVVVNQKKNLRNRMLNSELKTAIKKIDALIDSNEIDAAEALLPETFSIIDGAATKGIIHANNAANKKARLAKRISDIKSGKKEIVIKKDNKTIAAEKRAAKLAKEEALAIEAKKLAAEKAAEKAAAKAAAEEAKKPTTKKKTSKKETVEEVTEKPKKTSRKKKEDATEESK